MKSVADVAAIADPMERLTAAATLVRQAEAKAETLRTKRDLAILVMLRPFADAVAKANAARADLRNDLDAGVLTETEFRTALAENRDRRRADLEAAGVTVYPVDVYEMLGVGRSLVNRVLMRMPVEPLPPMRDPAKAARDAHAKIKAMEQTIIDAREIRDTAAMILMSGHDETGKAVPPVSNAEIARATQLTTARVAQLRESVR